MHIGDMTIRLRRVTPLISIGSNSFTKTITLFR